MLIAGATDQTGAPIDVRIERGRIVAVGRIAPEPGETPFAAAGGLLLPGLHDHHIHLAALAAERASVRVGPPDVTDRDGLAAALARDGGTGWLRATGYHDGVAGPLDRATLDAIAPHRPVRVQHRSGRLWTLNTRALDALLAHADAPAGLDRASGRLFEEDGWLRRTLGGVPPDLAGVGRDLARRGVTGVTDMTPANDRTIARHVAAQQAAGALPQTVRLAGSLALDAGDLGPRTTLGEAKLHLHEAALPGYDEVVAFARTAHDRARAVAVHCVSEVELVFALTAIAEAGVRPGDRIEHASIAPDHAVATIAALGLAVVAQPHFVAERGDAYRTDVEADAQPWLYRLASFAAAGVTLAGGSDAPFGRPDPWASMAAAVTRRTASGVAMGVGEALTPEAALDLYLAAPGALDRRRRIAIGEPADLCLLDRPWARARDDLAAVAVAATWIGGRRIADPDAAGPPAA